MTYDSCESTVKHAHRLGNAVEFSLHLFERTVRPLRLRGLRSDVRVAGPRPADARRRPVHSSAVERPIPAFPVDAADVADG